MPAINAPSAIDRPRRWVIEAAPKVTSSRLSIKSSCERRRATMSNHLLITRCPTKSSSTSATDILNAAKPSSRSEERRVFRSVEHKELLRTTPRDDVEPFAHHALSDEEQQHQCDRYLERGKTEL